jgi:hypothetical protein
MTLQEIFNRVRIYTRDTTGSIFSEADITIFVEEAFNRFTIIPAFEGLIYPSAKTTQIKMIPVNFQYLLSLYGASRCLFQDEQDYRAGTLMNEFEQKMEEMYNLIEQGQIVIKDNNGLSVVIKSFNDSVVDVYFNKRISDDDIFGTNDD